MSYERWFERQNKPEEILRVLRRGRADKNKFTVNELRLAIDETCGFDVRTYNKYKAILVRYGFIESHRKHVVLLEKGRSVGVDTPVLTTAPPPIERSSSADDEFLQGESDEEEQRRAGFGLFH